MEREYLKTSNLDLAATLHAMGLPIDGIHTRGASGTFDFYFAKSEQVQKAMDSFWSKALKIEPQELFGARKEIITRMKDEESTKKFN